MKHTLMSAAVGALMLAGTPASFAQSAGQVQNQTTQGGTWSAPGAPQVGTPAYPNSDSQAPNYQAPGSPGYQAPGYPGPAQRTPGYQPLPSYQAPGNPAPDDRTPNVQTPGAPMYQAPMSPTSPMPGTTMPEGSMPGSASPRLETPGDNPQTTGAPVYSPGGAMTDHSAARQEMMAPAVQGAYGSHRAMSGSRDLAQPTPAPIVVDKFVDLTAEPGPPADLAAARKEAVNALQWEKTEACKSAASRSECITQAEQRYKDQMANIRDLQQQRRQ